MYIPAMATLRQPAAHRGASAAALRAMCMCVLATIAGASVGINYGTYGDNLPQPALAVALLKKEGVTQARIRDANPNVLNAFKGSNIQIIVGISNDELLGVGGDNATAYKWVKDHIVPFSTTCNITCITVGYEVLTTMPSLSIMILPAMTFIHSALVSYGLDSMIKVSTPFSVDILESTFPPSAAVFNRNFSSFTIQPVLDFISATGSFYMLNVYPYNAYMQDPQGISLDYALFRTNPGVVDSASGFVYSNAFDALLDATYAAIAKLNHTDLQIVVSETGWPSQGDANDTAATPSNAQTYNANLVKHVLSKTGSPGRPGVMIITYVYELFNEDKKQGPASSRNYGLFNPDITPVYAVDLSGSGLTIGNSGGSGGSSGSPPTVTVVNRTWCVAKPGASESTLQAALDYACGLGRADCVPIQVGQTCYLPNTRASHASYAMNSYYQKYANSPNSCDFQGAAVVTTKDPSYSTCLYTASTQVITRKGDAVALSPRGAMLNGLLYTVALILALSLR